MAVNLAPPADLQVVGGVRLGATCARIKRADRDDLLVIALDSGAATAGVFTRSAFRAAPVRICEIHLREGDIRALVINSGNANAATGEPGHEDALTICAAVAKALGCRKEQVLPFSTGVIGVRLPVAQMCDAVPAAIAALDAEAWLRAAHAIMTTDTVAKARSKRFALGGVQCAATGMCKGAGMIKPDMATMLAYVATDATVDVLLLQRLTRWLADRSFNRVTIDGDTSTNDSFIVMATGKAGAAPITSETDPNYLVLRDSLLALCAELAQSIARDGEGATRFVTIDVIGARDDEEASRVAFTIAESPLIKTAMFAGDPNWGRFCMAIGRAGVAELDTRGVSLFLDDVCVARGGMLSTEYSEAEGARVMAQPEYRVQVDLSRGHGKDRVWTCDFSYDYVKINAEYRT